jgi:hypothetical protein
VRPLARDIALMDVTRPYQKHSMEELQRDKQEFISTIKRVGEEIEKEALDEGYSSREIEGPDSRSNLRK